MKGLIRISAVLIIIAGLGASLLSLLPLVYFVDESIAVNELSDFALKMGDLHQKYKKQLTKGTGFILKTIYQNAVVFVSSWLLFIVILVIKFCGVEIFFLRERGRKLIIAASIIAVIVGIICGIFTLQLLSMMSALVVVGSKDLDKFALLSNTSAQQVALITLIWIILNGLVIYWFTRPKVKEQFRSV